MNQGDGAEQVYENVETGDELSVYDLAIGARFAPLERDLTEGPEDAVRFNGDLYIPVDAVESSN